MDIAFRNIERTKEDLAKLHVELLQLEKRVNSVRESLERAITDLFGSDLPAFPALQEAALATRIAEVVLSRLSVPSQAPAIRKQYVREREAAEYMGVSVSALRSWRMSRSKSGPPFTRVGKMVMYPMSNLEEHMRAGLVPRRG